MSKRRNSFLVKYNWDSESKLMKLYSELLSEQAIKSRNLNIRLFIPGFSYVNKY
jgi:hypothetical protein